MRAWPGLHVPTVHANHTDIIQILALTDGGALLPEAFSVPSNWASAPFQCILTKQFMV